MKEINLINYSLKETPHIGVGVKRMTLDYSISYSFEELVSFNREYESVNGELMQEESVGLYFVTDPNLVLPHLVNFEGVVIPFLIVEALKEPKTKDKQELDDIFLNELINGLGTPRIQYMLNGEIEVNDIGDGIVIYGHDYH